MKRSDIFFESCFLHSRQHYIKQEMDTREAVVSAVEECIREGILREFLTAHKEEVIDMSIFEYDEELARQAAVEDGMEIGYEKGMEKGIEQGMKTGMERGVEKGREQGIEQGIEKGILSSIESLMRKKEMMPEEAMDALDIPEEKRQKYKAMILAKK